MITHNATFETLAKAPVKQSDVIVVKQLPTETGYVATTPSYTSSGVLMEVKIDSVGEMLGTATKKATVTLIGITNTVQTKDLFKISLGLYNTSLSAFNYISQGFFIVDTIDYNYDAGSTTITMYDHMWTATNTLFEESVGTGAITYPVTVQNFALHIASLLGLTLPASFTSLPNSQFSIIANLYSTSSGATLQNVIQDIAGATGTTARVTDTTLTFSQYSPSTQNLDSATLKTLKIGDTYGPITSVVLGRSPQNDNITIFSANPQVNTVESVNITSNLLTITAHGMTSGNFVRIASTGTLPAPLVANTNYYIFTNGNVNTFALALTYSDAVAGINLIDLTSVGSGTITLPVLTTREIRIINNQILDNDRQILLPALYNKLSGIDWTDVKADTIGLGWHEVGDVILFTQGTKTVRAFLKEVHLVLAGSIKENLVSSIPDVASINYQTAGGILKTLRNAEIKVDKQANLITSVVSEQTVLKDAVLTNSTKITQTIAEINFTIQKSGGGNLLLNSVGYAKEQTLDANLIYYPKLLYWNYAGVDTVLGVPTVVPYKVANHGIVSSSDSSESQNFGGISGQVIQMSRDPVQQRPVRITQKINVAVNTPLSFGMRVRNAIGKGDALVILSNDNNTFYAYIDDVNDYAWTEISKVNFVSTMSWLDITIESVAENFLFTDLRVLYGSTLQGWVQSNAEILSANVQFTSDGMRIFDESHNTETRVTYNQFSTKRKTDGTVLFEADDTGVVTNNLNIKGGTNFIREGKTVIKAITIPVGNAKAGLAWIKVLE